MSGSATSAQVILAHHRHPHNRGSLPAPDGVATRHNPLCGESLTVSVKLDPDARVAAVRFDGESCSIGRASASMMTDLVTGLTRAEIATLEARVKALVAGDPDAAREAPGDLQALAEIRRTPARAACALLPWDALGAALSDALATPPG